MDERPTIAITGVAGRMGHALATRVVGEGAWRLSGALARAGHDWVGRDLGEVLGGSASGVTVVDDPAEALKDARAVVDFSTPAATVAVSRAAAASGVAHVIGTTGLGSDDLTQIARAARRIPVVRAGNMSLGVNLLARLTARVAAILGPDYDIEIVEAHHRHKVDAPSGTALMLGEAAAAGRGRRLSDVEVRGRDGETGPRAPGAIGFAAIRGGDIVGEHDVVFAAPGERLVLRHVATDREIFIRGALHAARWALNEKAGEYDMMDVLGL